MESEQEISKSFRLTEKTLYCVKQLSRGLGKRISFSGMNFQAVNTLSDRRWRPFVRRSSYWLHSWRLFVILAAVVGLHALSIPAYSLLPFFWGWTDNAKITEERIVVSFLPFFEEQNRPAPLRAAVIKPQTNEDDVISERKVEALTTPDSSDREKPLPVIEPEKKKPEPPPPDEIRGTIAFSPGEAEEQPPRDKQFLSDRNSSARNEAPAEKPDKNPNVTGDSELVNNIGRSGFPTERPKQDRFYEQGSVEKKESPSAADGKVGNPNDREVAEETKAQKGQSAVEAILPQTNRPGTNLPPTIPGGDLGEGGESKNAIEGLTEKEPLSALETLKRKLAGIPTQGGAPVAAGEAGPVGPEARTAQAGQEYLADQPEQRAKEEKGDQGRGNSMNRQKRAEQEDPTFAARLPGEPQPGSPENADDLETLNEKSAVAVRGPPAFATEKSPEAVYWKEFFRRLSIKLNANMRATPRVVSRLYMGQAALTVTMGFDGRLLEVVEDRAERSGDLPAEAAALAVQAIRDASPHKPFPAELADREKLSVTIWFYFR
jgi:hypothetical protein